MAYDPITKDDEEFWFSQMSEWRERGDRNVYEFPGMIRALGFGGISKNDARTLFEKWSQKFA